MACLNGILPTRLPSLWGGCQEAIFLARTPGDSYPVMRQMQKLALQGKMAVCFQDRVS